jgi:hypothetical protein
MDPIQEPRVLVVFYSRTGNTAAVAQGLARASEADVEVIEVAIRRAGLLGYLLSGLEAMFDREALILPTKRNPRDYDIVLIGTPIWNSAMSSPVHWPPADLLHASEVAPCLGEAAAQVHDLGRCGSHRCIAVRSSADVLDSLEHPDHCFGQAVHAARAHRSRYLRG